MVDEGAGQLGDRQHPLVVLEDPAELAGADAELADAVAADELDQHERQHRRHARAVQLLGDAHQRHPRALGPRLAQPPQQFGEAEREQLAVEVADQLVDVGDGDHERDRLAVELGDADQVLVDDRLQFLAGISDLRLGQRHEPPIVRPGVVEQVEDDPRLLGEARLVDLADADARVALPRGDQAVDLVVLPIGDVDFVGEQVLGLGVARRLDPRLILRPVVRHHRRRRLVEAFDLQPRLVPDRQADRPEHAGHALGAKPLLGGFDERGGDIRVDRLEHAEIAGALPHLHLDELVDLRADPADRLAAARRQPEAGARMFEPRVLAGRDQRMHFALERRHPRRIASVDRPRQVDEGPALLGRLDRADAERVPGYRDSVAPPGRW